MKKSAKIVSMVLVMSALFILSAKVFSHCQIPCGIYDDQMRFDMMAEHVRTLEKSMNMVNELTAEKNHSPNQLVRWVINKENHADYLSEIVAQYFMMQRITSVEKSDEAAYHDYICKLTLLHRILVNSMKCKQTTNLEYVRKLRENLEDFRKAYFGENADPAHGHGYSR